jgi:hypothetical protein
MPVKIFFCYAHEDEALLNKLKSHLRPLQRKDLIDVWYDRDISAGMKWEEEIDKHLNEANIILLLVSPDFMDSDYCYGKEMQRALERDQQGEACVIPIILRPIYWQDVLGDLQALPKEGRPIVDRYWHNLDEAFFNVAEGIRTVVMHLSAPAVAASHTGSSDTQQKFTSPILTTPAVKQKRNVSTHLPPRAVEKQALLHTLSVHTGTVYSIALSADGQTLISGSGDETIKVWNLSTGQQVRTLTGHTDPVLCITLSADGQTLISGSGD